MSECPACLGTRRHAHFPGRPCSVCGGKTLIIDGENLMMTDKEVMDALRSDTPLNRARAVFSSECGRIEQADAQRRPPSPIEIRRMEFEAVKRIAEALGVTDLEPALQHDKRAD